MYYYTDYSEGRRLQIQLQLITFTLSTITISCLVEPGWSALELATLVEPTTLPSSPICHRMLVQAVVPGCSDPDLSGSICQAKDKILVSARTDHSI